MIAKQLRSRGRCLSIGQLDHPASLEDAPAIMTSKVLQVGEVRLGTDPTPDGAVVIDRIQQARYLVLLGLSTVSYVRMRAAVFMSIAL
jgi:hypothetical protein